MVIVAFTPKKDRNLPEIRSVARCRESDAVHGGYYPGAFPRFSLMICKAIERAPPSQPVTKTPPAVTHGLNSQGDFLMASAQFDA
jgi:hypothetical protein